MGNYDARLELAPRDVVARAIQDQMLSRGEAHVLLDISHCQRDHVLTHFPNIAAQCLQQGIDITADPIPVAPAAHYMCGGVQVRPLMRCTESIGGAGSKRAGLLVMQHHQKWSTVCLGERSARRIETICLIRWTRATSSHLYDKD